MPIRLLSTNGKDHMNKTSKKLSAVMSFLNERDEVANTVRSIRETADDTVDIVVVNDASDSDYDYEKDLAGLNVKYHVCNERLGAAQGKQKAVELCDTPYFILLDAHMRFYDRDWANKLVAELDKNPNQLLCCQTKVLSKDDGGTLTDKGLMGVYGAYITFTPDELIPNIKWNNGKIATSLAKGQIPAVLGASYCTSKTYWDKLKGLQGLIHYGCEEAYISIKAWLEGGGCHLIDDIVIGHLYRKRAPYHIDTVLNNYNYYLIAETLLPPLLCAKVHAVGVTLNKQLYLSAMEELAKNEDAISTLRSYYAHNLTAHDFAFIADINNVLTQKDTIILKEEEHRLQDVVRQQQTAAPNIADIGLYGGQCGAMLALALYAQMFDDEAADNTATAIFNNILRSISSDIPITFNNGLCGIGWALVFLVSQGIIDYSDIRNELTTIDRLVMERSLARVADTSLSCGTGGVIAYIISRIAICQSNTPLPFNEEYLKEAYHAALTLRNTEEKDWRTLTFAIAFIKCYEQGSWTLTVPHIEDLYDLPTFLPKEVSYQRLDMQGIMGFALYLTERKQRAKTFRNLN